MDKWHTAQKIEKQWHDNCINSYEEETKQIFYMQHAGLELLKIDGKYPVIDFQNKSVIDIGGGAYSPLLKAINVNGTVLDPCDYPDWIYTRYETAGLKSVKQRAEDYCNDLYDIGLMFNVLQHVENPKLVVDNAIKMCKKIYLFEWIDAPTNEAHIHTLKEEELSKWLNGKYKIGFEQNTKFFAGCFI